MKVTCEWRFVVLSQGVPELSEHGDVYELGFGLGPKHPPTSALIKPEYRRKLLYHMSPQQVFSILFYLISLCFKSDIFFSQSKSFVLMLAVFVYECCQGMCVGCVTNETRSGSGANDSKSWRKRTRSGGLRAARVHQDVARPGDETGAAGGDDEKVATERSVRRGQWPFTFLL